MAGAETGIGAPGDPSGAGGPPRPRRMGSSTSRQVTRTENLDTRELAFAEVRPGHLLRHDSPHSLRQGFKDEPDNS